MRLSQQSLLSPLVYQPGRPWAYVNISIENSWQQEVLLVAEKVHFQYTVKAAVLLTHFQKQFKIWTMCVRARVCIYIGWKGEWNIQNSQNTHEKRIHIFLPCAYVR